VGDRIGVYRNKGEGMACHPTRVGLLLGAISAVAISPARAEPAPQPTCPQMQTITVTECVPEQYQCKRTVYRMECRQETYDTCRSESVCEQRERTVTCQVPEYKTVMKQVCSTVTCYEDRVTIKTCHEYQQQTCMVKKCVSRGHWECHEVCKQPSCLEKLCNPCACPHTVTKKKWVHCPEYQECPVTKCVKVCVQKPVCCKVKVCKQVVNEVPCQVCTYRCVQKVEKYNVMVCRQVPCKATRTVQVCVPHEETVTCCRMVARQVQRQVPVTTCCAPTTCCQSSCCPTDCCSSCCQQKCKHRSAGLGMRQHGCGGGCY
jgi:hypothetical protein